MEKVKYNENTSFLFENAPQNLGIEWKETVFKFIEGCLHLEIEDEIVSTYL